MPMPTQEQFDAAPLYRFRLPDPEPEERNWQGNEIVVGGLNLSRIDTEVGGFEYRLEGVPIAVGGPIEGIGAPAFGVQYLSSDDETRITSESREEAIDRLGRMVERAVLSHDEILFLRLRQQGVSVDDIVDEAETEDGELADAEPAYGEPVRCVREGNRIWREGDEASLLWPEAKHEMLRCNEDGEILCEAGSPILHQVHPLRDAVGAERHVADIRAIRATIGDAERIGPVDTRYALFFFDLQDTGIPDAVVSQEALEAFRGSRLGSYVLDGGEGLEIEGEQLPEPIDPTLVAHGRVFERHISQIIRSEAGLSMPFGEVRSNGLYHDARVRGEMRRQMTPYLGGFPMEHVLQCPAPRDPEGHAAFMAFWQEGEVVMDVPVQVSEIQPGYRTNPGQVFRRDGWDALVFSDDMNLYCYAFPSPPEVVAKPADPKEAFAPRM